MSVLEAIDAGFQCKTQEQFNGCLLHVSRLLKQEGNDELADWIETNRAANIGHKYGKEERNGVLLAISFKYKQ